MKHFQQNHSPLFQAHPQKLRWMGISLIIFSITFMLLPILFIDQHNNHSNKQIFHLLFMLMTGLVLYFIKFQLTTEKAVVSLGKIFIATTFQADLTHSIHLKMPQNHQQLELNRKLTLFKRPDPQTFWQQHAILTFPQNKVNGSLFRPPLNQLYLHLFSKKQVDKLFQILKQEWQFNPEYIETPSPRQLQQERQAQDIGKRTPSIIMISVFIGIIGAVLPFQFSNGLHFAIEPYSPLPIFMLLALLIIYPFIKAEKKKYPLISATICSFVLGCSLYFLALQCNRLYSEHTSSQQVIHMTFEQMDHRSQVWRLDPILAQKFKLPYIYIHQDWQGYNADLKQGKHYEVTIRQGLFNDYFVDIDSFKKAELAR